MGHTDGQTDGRTDGRMGRTGATLRIGGGIKMQELSSLFMTHHLSVMHALVKCHEYIPYG